MSEDIQNAAVRQRRSLLQAVAALTLASAGSQAASADEARPVTRAAEALLGKTPGKPGDFEFLAGQWRIAHRRLKQAGTDDWDVFEGEATCWSILGGVGSVEELRIPARKFSGMGLRLLDQTQHRWLDYWVNSKNGVLTPPGMPGTFEGGAGLFYADDADEAGKPLLIRGVWDRITLRSCRWHQATSSDGGKNWFVNWEMDWTKV